MERETEKTGGNIKKTGRITHPALAVFTVSDTKQIRTDLLTQTSSDTFVLVTRGGIEPPFPA